MIPYADMGKKMNSFCRLPAIRRAEILKYHTMKVRYSGHLRNTMYGAGMALSG